MAFKTTQCGGLKINSGNMKVVNGTITDVNSTAITGKLTPECGGQLFDSGYFAVVKGTVTMKGVSTISSKLIANCSLEFDASKFALDSDGAIKYNSNILSVLTVTTDPVDATVVITDENDMAVPTLGDGEYNVIIGRTYTYTISKEGYVTQTDDITVDAATETLNITLVVEGG